MVQSGDRARVAHKAAVMTALLLLSTFLAACGPASGASPAPPSATPPQLTPGPAANQSFLMSGVIRDIGSAGILVEGPAGDACWVQLPSGMPLVLERPDGTGHDVDARDLALGMQVSVWNDGPVRESYPCQATGAYVKIHADPGDLAVPPLADIVSARRSGGPGVEPALLQASVPGDQAELARIVTWLLLAEQEVGLQPEPAPPLRGPSEPWVLQLIDDGQAVLDFAFNCDGADGGVMCAKYEDYVTYTDPAGERHVLRSPELFAWLLDMSPEE